MGMMINRRRAYGEGSNSFIKFADPTMKSLCVGLWGGADGGTAPLNTRVNNTKVLGVDGELTYEQAASIKSIVDSQFSKNTTITSFDELQYFTELLSIGQYAFIDCSSLRSIEIPDSVTSIGGMAFQKCSSLTNITIGSGVTSISVQVFSNCTRLNSITIQTTTPPILSHENSFAFTNNCPIYVPSGSVEAYKNANVWSNLSSRILAIPTN